MKKFLLFIGCLISCSIYSQSASKVFQDWTTTAGTQNMFKKNVTKTDGSNVYVAGATMNGAGNYDIFITKFNDKGELQWNRQMNGSANYHDLATGLYVTDSGNVVVTGAIVNDSVSLTSDIVTIKLNGGTGSIIWSQTFDAGGNLYDSGSDIIVSDSGYVYITGSGFNSNPDIDFVILKYSSTGVLKWSALRDYGSMNDYAVKITDMSADDIVVAGAGQTSSTDYDVIAYTLKKRNGTGGNTYTNWGGSIGADIITDATRDSLGNYYISGGIPTLSHGYDTYLVKLDSNLVYQWDVTYDGADHLDDYANGVKVSATGDVYITGSSRSSSTSDDYLTLKYSSGGTLVWARTYNDSLNGNDVANAIITDSKGNICITGSAQTLTNGSDYYTIKYDTAGTVQWSIHLDGHHLNDKATNMAVNMLGDLIVTGQSETAPGVYEYATVKYIENIAPPTHADMGVTYDVNGDILNERSTVIIRFNPDYLKMNAIDNRDLHCSHASTFIDDTLLYMMGQKLFTGTAEARFYQMQNITARKIFTYMSSADSISVTRSGRHMHVPPFWATLELYFPGIDEYRICDSLKKIFPQIYYVHPNFVASPFSIPNDSSYDDQASLAPTTSFPSANINVEPAWDIETGKKFVKVGVYDTGIDSLHPDIDVANRIDIELFAAGGFGSAVDGHGTPVAGIIGAKRNNSIGIAGIAGGDGTDSTGCSIYDMDIGSDVEIFSDQASQGIVVGAADYYYVTLFPGFPEATGLSLSIMNDSWGGSLDDFTRAPPDETEIPIGHISCYLCLEAIEFAYRNGCIQVASRGNWKYITGSASLPTDPIFPACSKDEFILNVGSVGADGEHKTLTNGAFGDASDEYTSMYSHHVDIVAPGTKATVYTTRSQTISPYTQQYNAFSGTSSAAPHVAGVAALMLSHVNTPCPSEKNLSQEDVEYILQRTASDRILSGSGYDDTTGFGLLDAGAALQAIEEPYYQIIHVNNTPVSITTVPDDTASLHLYSPYQSGTNGPYEHILPNIPEGDYYVQRYKTTAIVNHSAKLAHLTSSSVILDKWIRNSGSSGWGKYSSGDHLGTWYHDLLDVTSNVTLDSISPTTATLTAYTYFVSSSVDGLISVNQWYPADTNQFKFSYSIYVYDSAAVSVPNYPCDTTAPVAVEEVKPTSPSLEILNVYPVPASDNITIEYNVPYNSEARISLTDLLGRTVLSPQITSHSAGSYKAFINISNLAKGCYILQLATPIEKTERRFVIIH